MQICLVAKGIFYAQNSSTWLLFCRTGVLFLLGSSGPVDIKLLIQIISKLQLLAIRHLNHILAKMEKEIEVGDGGVTTA